MAGRIFYPPPKRSEFFILNTLDKTQKNIYNTHEFKMQAALQEQPHFPENKKTCIPIHAQPPVVSVFIPNQWFRMVP